MNNRQRRAAKKKKARPHRGQDRRWSSEQPELTADDVRHLLLDVVHRISDDSSAAAQAAAALLAPRRPLTADIVRAGLRSLLTDLVRTVTAHGWSPADLVHVTARLASTGHVPLVVGLLREDAARHPADRVAAGWARDLLEAGAAAPLELDTAVGVQQALELAASLAQLPHIPAVLPAPGSKDPGSPVPEKDRKLLARVQALLAKAEATEFDEEAEALSAKAQELVSRHALERLLDDAGTGQRDGQQPVVRRVRLESPYVFPKAMLVHVVASANRCRSVVAERYGFCTLVGHPQDLDAVEVLFPSLLVQAHTAMARFGRQTDRSGTSRTRSFRQSFLLAYAGRIGERLHAAGDDAAHSSGRGGELVPVLQRHAERVDAACDELFPHLVTKSGTVANPTGWAAGRAAADGALLGADVQLSERTDVAS